MNILLLVPPTLLFIADPLGGRPRAQELQDGRLPGWLAHCLAQDTHCRYVPYVLEICFAHFLLSPAALRASSRWDEQFVSRGLLYNKGGWLSTHVIRACAARSFGAVRGPTTRINGPEKATERLHTVLHSGGE